MGLKTERTRIWMIVAIHCVHNNRDAQLHAAKTTEPLRLQLLRLL
jgi:hypothetical protein